MHVDNMLLCTLRYGCAVNCMLSLLSFYAYYAVVYRVIVVRASSAGAIRSAGLQRSHWLGW